MSGMQRQTDAARGERHGSGDLLRATRRDFGRALFFAFLLTAGCNLLSLLVPLYSMELYNLVLGTRNTNTLAWLTAGLAFALTIYAALEYVRSILYDAMVDRAAR